MAAAQSKNASRTSAANRRTRARSSPAVRQLREQFAVNRKVFSRLLGYSDRAIAKWESGEPLAGPSLQRVTEIQRLQEGLSRIMKSEFVGRWLQSPNDAFGGLKPLEVIERGQIDRLWRMIYEVESGLPT